MSSKPGPKPKKRGIKATRASSMRAPAYLPDGAKKAWRSIVPELDRMYGLSELDRSGLVAICLAVNGMAEASQAIKEHGALVAGAKGNLVRNPAYLLARDCQSQLKSWCSEFGLSPSARLMLPADMRSTTKAVNITELIEELWADE